MFRAILVAGCAALGACVTAPAHRAEVTDDSAERVTAGRVQKEIHVGMSGAEVAEVLGSPNIVTTDEQRREVWIYDRIATDVVYSNSKGALAGLILGFGGNAGGGGAGALLRNAGASSTSQRSFTVIVKYDRESRVRDFSYRVARF